jgi:hypothetical protein
MLAASLKKKTKMSSTHLQPILPIVPEEVLENVEEKKSKYISNDVKAKVGATGVNASTYKKYIKLFDEGTPQEWLNTMQCLEEVWTQNSLVSASDRVSTIRAILRGESLASFESMLQEARVEEEGVEAPIRVEHIKEALDQVTKEVFPHWVLDIQRLWMQRAMKKPFDLSICKTVSSIVKINNSLPHFPSASENAKFSDKELISLKEWSLPQKWQAKFDLDGYILTEHCKKCLVEACEAIERSENSKEVSKKETKKKN